MRMFVAFVRAFVLLCSYYVNLSQSCTLKKPKSQSPMFWSQRVDGNQCFARRRNQAAGQKTGFKMVMMVMMNKTIAPMKHERSLLLSTMAKVMMIKEGNGEGEQKREDIVAPWTTMPQMN